MEIFLNEYKLLCWGKIDDNQFLSALRGASVGVSVSAVSAVGVSLTTGVGALNVVRLGCVFGILGIFGGLFGMYLYNKNNEY